MERLDNQVAIVTGGSGSIGSKIVRKLASKGAKLIIHYHQNEDSAANLKIELEEKGAECHIIKGDLKKPEDAKMVVDFTIEKFGSIDILVNCTGVVFDQIMILLKNEEWRNVFDTNLSSALYMCKYVSPYMKKQKYGRILNISSITGIIAQKMRTNYGASKRAVLGFTRAISRELAPFGIAVNAMCPQVVEGGVSKSASKSEIKQILDFTPIGYIAKPEDIADMALFFCSREAKYVIGASINTTGGLVTWQI